MLCKIEDCDRWVTAHGMCTVHYERDRDFPGDLEKLHAPIRRRERGRLCSMEDCANKHDANDLCTKHRVRLLRTGSLELQPRKKKPKPEAKPCTVEDCEKPIKCNGRCSMHETRWRKHGTLDGPESRRPDPVLRFAENIEAYGECWIWTGKTDEDGYGYFWVDGKYQRAHRWLWQRLVNADLAEMHLDHMCNVPACVRPGHCQEITPAEHNALTRRRSELGREKPGWEWFADSKHRTIAELFFGLQHHLPTALQAGAFRL